MSIVETIKEKIQEHSCDHIFETRYDERFDDEDEKYHTYRIEECVKCGMVKSITEVERKPEKFSVEEFKEEQKKKFEEYEKELAKHKKLTQEDLKNLQETLVNTCISFLRERDIFNVDEVHLSIDGMHDSINFGSWTPTTDSSISAYGKCQTENGFIGTEKLGEYA